MLRITASRASPVLTSLQRLSSARTTALRPLHLHYSSASSTPSHTVTVIESRNSSSSNNNSNSNNNANVALTNTLLPEHRHHQPQHHQHPASALKGSVTNVVPLKVIDNTIVKRTSIAKSQRLNIDKERDGAGNVSAYGAADSYDLKMLITLLGSSFRHAPVSSVPEMSDLCVRAVPLDVDGKRAGDGEAFCFKDGVVVCWAMTDIQITHLLTLIKPAASGVYASDIVEGEREVMKYGFRDTKPTELVGETIMFNLHSQDDIHALEKFTFSNGLANSVKLAVYEALLTDFIKKTERIPFEMKEGREPKLSHHDVMQKLGELFYLRHKVTLTSDFVTTPDFYWDRPQLEHHFVHVSRALDLPRRTTIINEKLNHCQDLAGLLRNQMVEKHSVKLEWAVIGLITVEVFFELIHYLDRFMTVAH